MLLRAAHGLCVAVAAQDFPGLDDDAQDLHALGRACRPEIQKFAGALQGHRANKGVFITTASYSREALEYVNLINTKIVLIDGQQLASMMIDHNVGVSTVGMYELKKIDIDYFEGE